MSYASKEGDNVMTAIAALVSVAPIGKKKVVCGKQCRVMNPIISLVAMFFYAQTRLTR